MADVVHALMTLDGSLVYTVVALLVFAEAGLFFGFVFPGETAVVAGGVLASQGRIELPLLLAIVVAAAVIGDSVGYELGRRIGPRLLNAGVLRKHRKRVTGAQRLLRERGAAAVFLGRFTALLRALMPALAGSARMPYNRFLFYNALGGTLWGVGFVFVGFLAGAAYETVQHEVGTGIAIVIAVIVVVGLGVWAVRRRLAERAGR